MFGTLFGKHKEGVKPVEIPTDKSDMAVNNEGYNAALGHLGLAELLKGSLFRPKTYERLVHDLYEAGWTIDEVKTLLNGGKIVEKQEKN